MTEVVPDAVAVGSASVAAAEGVMAACAAAGPPPRKRSEAEA